MRNQLVAIAIALSIGIIAIVSVLTDSPDTPIKSRNASSVATESTVWASIPGPTATTSTSTTAAPEIAQPVTIERKAVVKAIAQKATTTTTVFTAEDKDMADVTTPLQMAQLEVGKRGSYADGGFWCAKAVSYFAEQAHVAGWVTEDGPAALYANAIRDGRVHALPEGGDMGFADLRDPATRARGDIPDVQIMHVFMVESVDGNEIHTIEGNALGSDVVIRNVRHLDDFYVIAFASFTK